MLTMDKRDSANGKVLIELIDSYSNRVKKRTALCAMTVCPHCGLDTVSTQTPFTFHGTRARRLLVLVGSFVRKVAALLARWRCPRCRRTFTDYPSFAAPYKAYTLPQMSERAARYVSNESTSYRKGVCSVNLPIFYAQAGEDKSAEDGNADYALNLTTLAHTSLFRWVATLAVAFLHSTTDLQSSFEPAPRKFTSEPRRYLLIACRAACSGLEFNQAANATTC
jgi:transposase-like protein